MDTYQAITNWGFFLCLAGGLAYYYYPKDKQATTKPAPVLKEAKKEKEPKKPARKPEQGGKSYAQITAEEPSSSDATTKPTIQNGNKKRKANNQPARESAPATAPEPADDDIDMSTRQFALNMQRARDGIQVKSASNDQTRVKSVKPKSSAANNQVLSSGSSQADAEEDWSPAVSPALKAGGIDDMLEPAAPGPSSLRILASEKPVQEKAKKQPKQEVTETKKQRQNRQKAEQRRLEQEEHNAEWKQRQEQQRRSAREARGEPARNGIPVPAAPTNNPWSERNAVRDTQLPVTTSDGSNAQLLDTFETESNSSSNQGASTAATSTTDAAPNGYADEDAAVAKMIEESERETGWIDVKTSKKGNKKKNHAQGDANGDATPVAAAPVPSSKANKATVKPAGKPVGFQALNDEAENSTAAGNDELANWTA